MQRGKEFLKSIFGRDDDAAALSRRDILGGLGLAGLLVAAPKLLGSSPAEARPLDKPAAAAAGSSPAENQATGNESEEGVVDLNAGDSDVTDLSARRYWRR